ncbi:hypothetical protein LMG29660_03334 [Burkholderia puraquae]|uniref:Uncharacterized protein n=1 Tax=Burkholderia puraquae TaxID=1904757 RepID=A0A6J5DX96_9BURK|nr:hypothetical protein LMG29660_03334 [Burkholderia puraquae]
MPAWKRRPADVTGGQGQLSGGDLHGRYNFNA